MVGLIDDLATKFRSTTQECRACTHVGKWHKKQIYKHPPGGEEGNLLLPHENVVSILGYYPGTKNTHAPMVIDKFRSQTKCILTHEALRLALLLTMYNGKVKVSDKF